MQFALKGSKYKDSSGNEVTCNIETTTLPNRDFRIIEGNLTKNYYPNGSGSKLDDDKNPL